MRILALTRYERLGSSSRVRFYQYYPYLIAHRVEVISAPFFSDEYVKGLYSGQIVSKSDILRAYLKRLLDLIKGSSYDLLWVEKELFPWMPAWFERLLQGLKKPYVVDYDDAVYHRYEMHRSSVVRALLGHKIDHVMRNAALVIAGNQYLADRATQAGAKSVELLPSVVDVGLYQVKKDDTTSPFQIGWIGSPVTARYLDEIRDALEILSREMDIRIVLIGSGNIQPFPNIPTVVHPWDERLELSISQLFDVGIMPLVDGPFERGKCGYKLIQYMAAGLPVIASPVGVNRQIVVHGTNGYLTGTTREWLEAFRKLGGDAQLRLKMGRSGRSTAEQMYNLHGTAPKLLDLLLGARKL